jgi:hypothetical protein
MTVIGEIFIQERLFKNENVKNYLEHAMELKRT